MVRDIHARRTLSIARITVKILSSVIEFRNRTKLSLLVVSLNFQGLQMK